MRRTFRRRSRKSTIMAMPMVVPDRLLTKVRYVDTMTLTGFTVPSETDSTLAFSYKDLLLTTANPFLKYGVITDDIPAGLLQWSQFYSNVAVTKVKVKVTPCSWIDATTSNPWLPYVVSLFPTTQPNLTDYNSATTDFLEQPKVRYKYFTQAGSFQQSGSLTGSTALYSAQSGQNNLKSVVATNTSREMLGYKNLFDADVGGADVSTGLWIPTDETSAANTGSLWNYVLTVKSTVPYQGNAGDIASFTLGSLICKIEVTSNLAFRNRRPILEETE